MDGGKSRMKTSDPIALDQWYALGQVADFPPGHSRRVILLGAALLTRHAADTIEVGELDDRGNWQRSLPHQIRYGHVWTTLGAPPRNLLDMPEFLEPDRKLVACGAIGVRTSGLRIIENFLDMAHFPFIHTDILGIEERPEVAPYDVEIRRDVDEIWASRCQFYQPLAAKAATQGQLTHYIYRVGSPFVVVLYKTSVVAPNRWDVIGLFVQPMEPAHCLVHSFVLVVDDKSRETDLIHFQQTIFIQDRLILESQRPALLPLMPGAELSTRADQSSMVYRRWLKDKGLRFGALSEVSA
jgi:phenylpropionate dioxygenase-like ring-hydroxylating dioxygenase large terminal subunit